MNIESCTIHSKQFTKYMSNAKGGSQHGEPFIYSAHRTLKKKTGSKLKLREFKVGSKMTRIGSFIQHRTGIPEHPPSTAVFSTYLNTKFRIRGSPPPPLIADDMKQKKKKSEEAYLRAQNRTYTLQQKDGKTEP